VKTSKGSDEDNEEPYCNPPLRWLIAPNQMGPRPRREDLLLSLKGQKSGPRKLGDSIRISEIRREYHEVSRVTEREAWDTAGKSLSEIVPPTVSHIVPLIVSLFSFRLLFRHCNIVYRFVIAISFIVSSLQYCLSFHHYNIVNRLVITVLLIVLSLRYRLSFRHCGIANII